MENRTQHLAFYLSTKCNLACKYCNLDKSEKFYSDINNDLIKFEQALEKRKELFPNIGIRHILISGGEPTLFPETLKAILDKYDSIYKFYIITNGTKPEILKELLHYNVDFIISYDGHTNERGFDSFETLKWLYSINRLKSISMVISNTSYLNLYDTLFELKQTFPKLYRKREMGVDPYELIQIDFVRSKPEYYKFNYELLEEQLTKVYEELNDCDLGIFINRGKELCENFYKFEEDCYCEHHSGELVEKGCFTRIKNLDNVFKIYKEKCEPCEVMNCHFKNCPVNISEFELNKEHPICTINKIIHKIIKEKEKKEFLIKQLQRCDQVELVLTDSCNLACKYCFQKGLHSTNVMTNEVIDNVFKKIIDLPSDYITNKTLSLFGGEPIQPCTLPIRNYILEYLKKPEYINKINISITTNGFSMTEEDINWFKEIKKYARFVFCQVSIDSIKEVNDQQRVTKTGTGTFEQVIKNLKLISGLIGKDFTSINSVITPESVVYLPKWCEYITKELHNKHISKMMVRIDQSRQDKLTLKEKFNYKRGYYELEELYNEGKINIEVLKYAFNVKRHMYDDNLITEKDEFSSCGMCDNFVLVDTDGTIRPCHSLLNTESERIETKIANLLDNSINNNVFNIYEKYGSVSDQYSELNGKKCSQCKYKMECVRCKVDHFKINGDFSKVLDYTCEVTRLRGDIYRKELFERFRPFNKEQIDEFMNDLNELKELYESSGNEAYLSIIHQMSNIAKEKKWYI